MWLFRIEITTIGGTTFPIYMKELTPIETVHDLKIRRILIPQSIRLYQQFVSQRLFGGTASKIVRGRSSL